MPLLLFGNDQSRHSYIWGAFSSGKKNLEKVLPNGTNSIWWQNGPKMRGEQLATTAVSGKKKFGVSPLHIGE